MNQNKLDVGARILSVEELEFKDRINTLNYKARELKKQKQARRTELRKRKDQQESCGLKTGEIPVTEELIKEKLKIYDKQIKRIERKVIRLQKLSPEVTKISQKQKNLGL